MSLLPWVKEPCPVLDRLDAMMDGDVCRMCKREVHDITKLDEAQREAFFDACKGDACVRYRFEAGPALAAALIAASTAVAVPVAAAPASHARRVPIMLAGIVARPPALALSPGRETPLPDLAPRPRRETPPARPDRPPPKE